MTHEEITEILNAAFAIPGKKIGLKLDKEFIKKRINRNQYE